MMRWIARLAVVVLIPFSLVGCLTLDSQRVSWFSANAGPPSGEVTQVLVVWADGLVTQPDPATGLPVPGFAGKAYLLDAAGSATLAAQGPLVVQQYDDAQPAQQQPAVPREVWNVDEFNLKRLQKKDGVGWGYPLFLPWTNYQVPARNVTLMVQYKPFEGREVWSSPSRLTIRDEMGLRRSTQMQTNSTNLNGSASK